MVLEVLIVHEAIAVPHAVVAVTTGLLPLLNKSELEGVLAHELAHIGNRDMLLQTVIVVFA